MNVSLRCPPTASVGDKHNPHPHEKKTVTVWEILGMEARSQAISQWRGSGWLDKTGREDRIKKIVTILSYCRRQVTKENSIKRNIDDIVTYYY